MNLLTIQKKHVHLFCKLLTIAKVFLLSLIFLRSEFQRLFDNFDYEFIREEILNRKMIECNFTTVLWRIFLHCLSRDSNQWDEMLETSRNNYEKLVQQYTVDPYKMSDDNQETKNLNHPLSRDENVPK
jgi:hypothetical protein